MSKVQNTDGESQEKNKKITEELKIKASENLFVEGLLKQLKETIRERELRDKKVKTNGQRADIETDKIINDSLQSPKLREFVESKKREERVKYLLELAAKSEVKFNAEIPKPPTCLNIINSNGDEAMIGRLGDFAMIIGKAKSRKTFLMATALAAFAKNGTVLNKLNATLPENKSFGIIFDTEMHQYDTQQMQHCACKVAGITEPNFKTINLREYPPDLRLEIIEAVLYTSVNLGYVIIDGVRDIVFSINDEESATKTASKLLQWTKQLNIFLICALHENKNDKNPRGHLGTELCNKAQTVISVTKDAENKSISVVNFEYCRAKEPEPFAFSIENDLPIIVDYLTPVNAKKGATAESIADVTHRELLAKVFAANPQPKYNELRTQLKLIFTDYNMKMSDNKLFEFIQYY